jgi:uncharacterized DUF497 family protein
MVVVVNLDARVFVDTLSGRYVGRGEAPERGLDFADAVLVFAGTHFTRAADRRDLGEDRSITAGFLRERAS